MSASFFLSGRKLDPVELDGIVLSSCIGQSAADHLDLAANQLVSF